MPEAEDEAKWRIYDDYKKAKAMFQSLVHEGKKKGEQFQELGGELIHSPGSLSVQGVEITMNANSPHLRQSV